MGERADTRPRVERTRQHGRPPASCREQAPDAPCQPRPRRASPNALASRLSRERRERATAVRATRRPLRVCTAFTASSLWLYGQLWREKRYCCQGVYRCTSSSMLFKCATASVVVDIDYRGFGFGRLASRDGFARGPERRGGPRMLHPDPHATRTKKSLPSYYGTILGSRGNLSDLTDLSPLH